MKTRFILPFLALIIGFSCSKDPDHIWPGPGPENQSSVFVMIKDAAGIPVEGARITMGLLSATTDESGICFFTNVMLSADDFIHVSKTGYFNGSRRFNSGSGSTQFVDIMLLPLKEVASYKSSGGASLYIDSKSRLIFPNQAVTLEDGSPYQGDVHVMAQPIYGDDPNLSAKMPGNLIGLDESDADVVLGSYGMMAVELFGDNNERLSIAPGKTVTIEMAIADNQLSHAPSTLPLWHFDEDKGIWIQEGQAERQGQVYVGQVSHFSWWNWDIPMESITWEASFAYANGQSAQQLDVCLSIDEFEGQYCIHTDGKGKISIRIPANKGGTYTVKNECGSIVLTEFIGPSGSDILTEKRTLPTQLPEYATIAGVALQCDSTPIRSGFVRIQTPAENYIFPISGTDGYFEGGYMFCSGDVTTLYVYDVEHDLVSPPRTYHFDRDLNIGAIYACQQPDEYIQFKVKGFAQKYFYFLPELTLLGTDYTQIESLDSIGVKGRFGFVFKSRTAGEYSATGAYGNQINLQNGQIAYITDMTVNVTEYGAPGQYIKGEFQGKVNRGGNGSGGNGSSDFNGSFSLRNE